MRRESFARSRTVNCIGAGTRRFPLNLAPFHGHGRPGARMAPRAGAACHAVPRLPRPAESQARPGRARPSPGRGPKARLGPRHPGPPEEEDLLVPGHERLPAVLPRDHLAPPGARRPRDDAERPSHREGGRVLARPSHRRGRRLHAPRRRLPPRPSLHHPQHGALAEPVRLPSGRPDPSGDRLARRPSARGRRVGLLLAGEGQPGLLGSAERLRGDPAGAAVFRREGGDSAGVGILSPTPPPPRGQEIPPLALASLPLAFLLRRARGPRLPDVAREGEGPPVGRSAPPPRVPAAPRWPVDPELEQLVSPSRDAGEALQDDHLPRPARRGSPPPVVTVATTCLSRGGP